MTGYQLKKIAAKNLAIYAREYAENLNAKMIDLDKKENLEKLMSIELQKLKII